jgi:hypothetical protein
MNERSGIPASVLIRPNVNETGANLEPPWLGVRLAAPLQWTHSNGNTQKRRDAKREKESTMPFALFEKDDQLSRSFSTREEVWQHAEDAGLVLDDNGTLKLEDHYTIKPCPADPEQDKRIDDWQMPKI